MTNIDKSETLEEYVNENRDTLVNVLVHSSDNFARGCALAFLIEGSDKKDIQEVIEELKKEVED